MWAAKGPLEAPRESIERVPGHPSMTTSVSAATTAFSFAGRVLERGRPHIMGVLNVTPDSFSDGGEVVVSGRVSLDLALRKAEKMLADGAAILDIGGESTRPGAEPVSSQEEIDRVLPVVEAVRDRLDTIISVDTSNPHLIDCCAGSGVSLINDVRALRREGALEAAAASGLPVCLMHMQGEPATMQQDPHYNDVAAEVRAFLEERVEACAAAGLHRERILLDPGFGFGKTLKHNVELLGRLEELTELGLPLLIGVSRKAMIGAITGKTARERTPGSIAAAIIAVMKGAWIVRTHDVAETADALNVYTTVTRGMGEEK